MGVTGELYGDGGKDGVMWGRAWMEVGERPSP